MERVVAALLAALPVVCGLLGADAAVAAGGAESGLGRIEGVVRVIGDARPAPTTVANTTDPEVCGLQHSLEDLIVEDGSGGVADAFAVLERVDASPPARLTADPPKLRLDNSGCRFVPHAAIVPVGTVLEAVNSDAVLHTVHLYGPTELNLALPFQGMSVEQELRLPGVYAVRCDVHGWMQALVRVVDQPHHALSDAHGRFSIAGVAAGEYVLDVWHERLGSRRLPIRVAPGATLTLDVGYDLETDPQGAER